MENSNAIAIRFEHPFDEFGIYNSIKIPSGEDWYENMRDRHVDDLPNPRRDSLLNGISKNEFCAFKSVESLKYYITNKEISKLLLEGFRVYEITLSEYQTGKYQILFKKESVLLKKDISKNICEKVL